MGIWINIKNERKLENGYIRIYSFEPVIDVTRPLNSLKRIYDTDRFRGNRICDYYTDLPQPPEKL